MQTNAITAKVFQKEHTVKEILHYIFDPDSPDLRLQVRVLYHVFKWIWVVLNLTATLGSCLILVLQSMPEFYTPELEGGGIILHWISLSELACVIFFTVDYSVRLYLTPNTIFNFVRDAHNIIDVLTTLPYYIELILSASNVRADWFRVLFLLRTFRIIKMSRYHPALNAVLTTITVTADLLILFIFLVLQAVIISATAFFYSENTHFDTATSAWYRNCATHEMQFNVYRATNCTTQISPYQSIPEAMYWSFVTITTVGFRSESPTSELGQTVAGFTAMLGVFFFAAPATLLATNYKILRRQAAAARAFKKIDMRTTAAMKAQERLKRELDLAYKNRGGNGNVKVRSKRSLKKVANFMFDGVQRPIYEVYQESYYVYPPIIAIDRLEDGSIRWTDDFNPTTSQRTLTLLMVLDSDEARGAARETLVKGGFINNAVTENDVLICADPWTQLDLRHEFDLAYPELNAVVELDDLMNPQGYMQDLVPVRFVVGMPHLYPSIQVTTLMKETRLTVTMKTRTEIDEMDIPLVIDIIMASRFVRELSEIAYYRKSDNALIAYIHSSDAAELFAGFADQFIPTPDPDVLVMDSYTVDHQVLLAMMTSFPNVRLLQVPGEAANAFYKGQHLSVDLSEEYLMEVSLTALASFDELGFGQRFRLQVPICKVERTDVQFQLV